MPPSALHEAIAARQRERQENVENIITLAVRMYQYSVQSRKRGNEDRERREDGKKSRGTRVWIRPWIERRHSHGAQVLIRELEVEDPTSFRNILRMNAELFHELLTMVAPLIQKNDTQMRPALSAQLKLEVTLRYLATGDSLKSLSYFFRLPCSSISTFLPHVLRAIHTVLAGSLQVPNTEAAWKDIALKFVQTWNFPRCCGAIDGKHISIRQPPASGSHFYNFKGFYSTVLLALVDANYNFIYVNVGTNGRANDAGIFKDSKLYKSLEKNSLNLPPEHVILGDSAFPLKTYLMKPYAFRNTSKKKTVFNYRLSRARRIVENAFGILVWRFRVFMAPIELKVRTVDHVVLAACSLHNWLRSKNPGYITAGMVDEEDENTGDIIAGRWRSEITELLSVSPRPVKNYTAAANLIREQYADYFWADGAIPSQWRATGISPHDGGPDYLEVDDLESPDEGMVTDEDDDI